MSFDVTAALSSMVLDFQSPASLLLAIATARLGWIAGADFAVARRIKKRFVTTRSKAARIGGLTPSIS